MDVRNYIILFLGEDRAITGKTRLIQALFLFSQKHEEFFKIARFYKHRLGPYSGVIGAAMNQLLKEGIIIAEKVRNTWCYKLSEKGKKQYKELVENAPPDLFNTIKETFEELKCSMKTR